MRLALFFILAVLCVALVGAGLLVYEGKLALPWAKPTPTAVAMKPGEVGVPLSVRSIAAYSRITREDLLDPDTGEMRLRPMSLGNNANAPFVKPGDIIGRVMRREKDAGYTFTEADFFPRGTLPGVAAGVPVGKRAVTLDASTVSGVRDLATGDHVDLLGTQAIDLSKTHASPTVGSLAFDGLKAADTRTLARDGVVVVPLKVRNVPYMTSGSLTSAAVTRTKPVEEIQIAIDPTEVAAVERAVGAGSAIACVLHSGQPTAAPVSDAMADAATPKKYAVVEQIVGDKHVVRLVPTTQEIGTSSPSDATPSPAGEEGVAR